MWDNAYKIFFDNRSVGQTQTKGSSLQGRYPGFQFPKTVRFENRTPGQSAGRISNKDMFMWSNMNRRPMFTTGVTTYSEPRDNVTVPTTIYSGENLNNGNGNGEPPEPSIGTPFGLQMHHVLLVMAITGMALILLLKK